MSTSTLPREEKEEEEGEYSKKRGPEKATLEQDETSTKRVRYENSVLPSGLHPPFRPEIPPTEGPLT
jgi:hypothetical protein